MSTNHDKDEKLLSRISEESVEDLMEMSDEEILAEAAEDFDDAAAVAAELRAKADALVMKSRRRKLVAARDGFERKSQVDAQKKLPFSRTTAQKRAAIANVLATRDDLPDKLTLAAREGTELTDSAVDAVYEDLFELGFLDDTEPRE